MKEQFAPSRWVAQAGSQALFLACSAYECLYHGTRGPGKTDALLADFLKHVGVGFGKAWRGILFRRSYKQLKDVIDRSWALFKAAFPAAKYNSTEHEWTFPDGEKLLFRYAERIQDYDEYHGWQVPWLAFEELCTWATPDLYLKLMSICRSSHPEVAKVARVRATANPLGVGHNWVKKRFRLGGNNKTRIIEENGLKRCAIFGHLRENKILLRSDPLYEKRLIASCKGNPLYIKAWLHGSWDVIAGGMFDDLWDPRAHVVERFDVPPSWRIDGAFDWGSSHPFSYGLYAQSDGSDYQDVHGDWHATVRGDVFRIAEWYGCTDEPNVGLKLHSAKIAEGIIALQLRLGLLGRVVQGPADPSIFTETDGKSYAGTMAQVVRVHGTQYAGPSFFKADNSRVTGWERVRDMLANAKPGPEGMREHAGLFVVGERCPKFLELFPVTQRDVDDPDDVDTESEDHLADEVRYRCKSASDAAVGGRVISPTGAVVETARTSPARPNAGRIEMR